MQLGDEVYYFHIGQPQGIVAVGRIVEPPQKSDSGYVVSSRVEARFPDVLTLDAVFRYVGYLAKYPWAKIEAGESLKLVGEEARDLRRAVDILANRSAEPPNQVVQRPQMREVELYAQPLSNDAPAGPDLLNVSVEANAIAEAIALKELQPPLVVGVLGGWGSGKSFVLHLIEEQLGRIRCEKLNVQPAAEGAAHEFPYVGHPYVIRFDAWTFAKANLWASLMQTIFVELNRQLSLEEALRKAGFDPLEGTEAWRVLSRLTDAQRKELLEHPLGKKALAVAAELDRGDHGTEVLWGALENLKQEEAQALDSAEKELAEKQAQHSKQRADLEKEVDNELAEEAKAAAWKTISEQVVKAVGGKVPEAAKEIKDLLGWWQRLRIGFDRGTLIFAALALGALIVPWLLELNAVKSALAWLSSAAGMVLGVLDALKGARKWIEEKQAALNEMKAKEQEARKERRATAVEDKLQAQRKQATPFSKLEADIRELHAKVEAHRRRIGITARYVSLLDFVRGRLDSLLYDEKLGMMHQVQKDLNDLSEALLPSPLDSPTQVEMKRKLFPRGEPRIVIVVDDLDRCPPSRVVEVLEATQLLVKTRLFVVILGMDVRYVTRALEKEYSGILVRNGDPSGLDYIEKIVQVPYRIRPIETKALEGFLRAHMKVKETREPPPAKGVGFVPAAIKADEPQAPSPEPPTKQVWSILPRQALEFDEDELKTLKECCDGVQNTPRSVKRLVNVFKLLKIIWHRKNLTVKPAIKRAMGLLLALCARYPEAMRRLLVDLEEAVRRNSTTEAMQEYLSNRTDFWKKNAREISGWDEIGYTVREGGLLKQGLRLSEFGGENLDLVGCFSFVGEDLVMADEDAGPPPNGGTGSLPAS